MSVQADEEARLRRRARTGSYTALAGVVGFTVCLLVRFSTVLPRWDLLAMLAVVGVGAAIRMHALRARVLNSSDPARQLRPDAPSQPPGFRAEQRLWWPRHKSATAAVVFWLCAVPVTLLALSAGQTTGVLERVRSSDFRIAEVTVVREETTTHRPRTRAKGESTSISTVEITAKTRADGRGQLLEGTIRRAQNISVVEGGRIWAMYVPASSPSPTEAVFATERSKLEDWAGGWTRNPGHLGSALMPALVLVVLLRLLRRGSLDGRGQEPVALQVHTGRARALRVRVTGVRTATLNKGNVLVLTAAEGERELLLGRWSDPRHVANSLAGQSGWLYWSRTAADRHTPPKTALRKAWHLLTLGRLRANVGPAALDSAVLVLADGRYLRGRTPRTLDGPMPAGRIVPRRHPDECPQVRPLEPRFLRLPALRPRAVLLWMPGLLMLLALSALPFGDLTTYWQLYTFLPWAVVMASGYASYRAATGSGARR
ncbi:hypothetical protein MTQ01_00370 [Streptomyces sp. XM4193]|uniref:hypothetical protein n=1 Tax=Streptomyces sp. XM4193 TaxID=2929782 RepID=UPI001FF8F1A7|nr:hypothetical protein [Streptomyces sp. XM4193]MCK1794506.1 hypothetical protein [Streptomyces sp. XM4193]